MPLIKEKNSAVCPNKGLNNNDNSPHNMAFHSEVVCLPLVKENNIDFRTVFPVVILKCISCGYSEFYSLHYFQEYFGMSFEEFKKKLQG